MTPAVAIFVKTSGLSPVKTRLAVGGMGAEAATEFHRLAAASVAGVARACRDDVAPYWAVAEREALAAPAWRGFPAIWQGEGGLGARLDRIYATLLQRHGRVLLIGADAPQITPDLLREAAGAIDEPVAPPYAVAPRVTAASGSSAAGRRCRCRFGKPWPTRPPTPAASWSPPCSPSGR